MPFENEHSCRLSSPPKEAGIKWGRGSQTINGKKVGTIYYNKGEHPVLQSLRFSKDNWSASEARKVCSSRGGSFEAARRTGESELTQQF